MCSTRKQGPIKCLPATQKSLNASIPPWRPSHLLKLAEAPWGPRPGTPPPIPGTPPPPIPHQLSPPAQLECSSRLDAISTMVPPSSVRFPIGGGRRSPSPRRLELPGASMAAVGAAATDLGGMAFGRGLQLAGCGWRGRNARVGTVECERSRELGSLHTGSLHTWAQAPRTGIPVVWASSRRA